MRFDVPRPRKDDEQSILPLINVVFLLLIFFILAGKLSAVDPIAVEPPRSAGDGSLEAQDLIVVLGADGTLIVPEALRAAIGSAAVSTTSATVDPATKPATAAQRSAAPIRTVWLKADGSADSLDVIAAIETLHDAGVQRLQLVTLPLAEDGRR